jgi:hypothetical protein
MAQDSWIVAMGIAIVLSLFMAGLGVISGKNVLGAEIEILYYGVLLFLTIIRVLLEIVVGFISMIMIIFGSFGLGVINWLLKTDFNAQIFYNFQTQALGGVEDMYFGFANFIKQISIINQNILGVEISISTSGKAEDTLISIGDSLRDVWDGSFGFVIEEVVDGVVTLVKRIFGEKEVYV